MLWACLVAQMKPDGIMNFTKYQDISGQNLVTSPWRLGLAHRWIFQQDKDTKHTCKSKIIVFQWPSQSPDLNRTKNLFYELKMLQNVLHGGLDFYHIRHHRKRFLFFLIEPSLNINCTGNFEMRKMTQLPQVFEMYKISLIACFTYFLFILFSIHSEADCTVFTVACPGCCCYSWL